MKPITLRKKYILPRESMIFNVWNDTTDKMIYGILDQIGDVLRRRKNFNQSESWGENVGKQLPYDSD